MPELKVVVSSNVPRGTVLDTGLVPLEDAARELGIEVKRLKGYLCDPRPWYPIGDRERVYRWSLAYVRERLAASAASAVVFSGGDR